MYVCICVCVCVYIYIYIYIYTYTERERENLYKLGEVYYLHLILRFFSMSLWLFLHFEYDLFCRGVQPVACRPHEAEDGYECSPKQNCKFTYSLFLCVCSSDFVCVCALKVWPKTTLLPPVGQKAGHTWLDFYLAFVPCDVS